MIGNVPLSILALRPCGQGGTWAQVCRAVDTRRLVLAGMMHSETLVEIDIRCMFSVLGPDNVLKIWFQIRNWQGTEQRTERGSECATPSTQVTPEKVTPSVTSEEPFLILLLELCTAFPSTQPASLFLCSSLRLSFCCLHETQTSNRRSQCQSGQQHLLADVQTTPIPRASQFPGQPEVPHPSSAVHSPYPLFWDTRAMDTSRSSSSEKQEPNKPLT